MDTLAEPKPQELRNKRRTELRWDRQVHRKADIDLNRAGLGEMLQEVRDIENLTPQHIKGLASRIKRRKRADSKDLVRLSYGFQQAEANISEFIRITGAINVVVKELTGHDSDLQQLAAECLCNLSLGDEVYCEKVATFAGTYLITFLENLSHRRLQITCLWTLQNIVASGPKACKVLHSQGVVSCLNHLLDIGGQSDPLPDVLLCIELILSYEFQFFGKDILLTTTMPLVMKKASSCNSLKVLYKALSLTNFEVLEYDAVPEIVTFCLKSLASGSEELRLSSTLLAIRILANLVASQEGCCTYLFERCLQQNIRFGCLFNDFAEAEEHAICRELLWLLGNIYRQAGKVELEQYLGYDQFCTQLVVPKKLLV
ncbi:uncharacterized protein LOC129748053 [Uranotaenia lowii]|uniref:uncharacterized protein LOC129748053 n=1 Tax=Uranotaenia lowii TaxID=190385 RepID=UPI00247A5247|nr:uncharacterized protein LOC129748053 [Uranotaenia lowii]